MKRNSCTYCSKPRAIKKIYMDGRLYEVKVLSLCYEHLVKARKSSLKYYYEKIAQ